MLKSLFGRNLLFTISSLFVLGIVLIIASYFIQKTVMTKSLTTQSMGVADLWISTFDTEDIKLALEDFDKSSENNIRLIENLTKLSDKNKNVAQGYFFGAEIVDGNKTMIMPGPKHLMDIEEVVLGDMLEQSNYWIDAAKMVLKEKKPASTNVYKDSIGTWVTTLEPVIDENGEVIAIFGIDTDASLITKSQNELVMKMSVALLLLLIVICFIQFIALRKIFAPVKDLFSAISLVGQGELNVRLPERRNDELGKLSQQFNAMVRNIRGMIKSVGETAEQVAASSEELLASAEQTALSTNEITLSIQEIANGIDTQESTTSESSNSMEKIAIGIIEIAKTSHDVSSASTLMYKQAQTGSEHIGKITEQMKTLNQSVNQSASIVKILGDRSKEIGQFVKVITEIASQTNLLALNAAIEAARAGESGKGFAVVADEVRKLAEQSEKSAQQITGVVHVIQQETLKAVESMNSGTIEVENGMKVVSDAGEVFGNILNSTDDVSNKISLVSEAAEKLSNESKQVSELVKNLNNIARESSDNVSTIAASSQQQNASMEEIQASAVALSKVSQEMQELMEQFKL